ncbi:MAG: glycosyltransferase family 2 protein [Candidatus Anstonellales archaeon]
MEYTLIIPAYNEESEIRRVVAGFRRIGARRIIVVDDGSLDKTMEMAARGGAHVVIRHRRNQGKGSAIKSGLFLSESRWIVLADGDGQHSPRELSKFLEKIKEGRFVFINGSRFLEGGVIWRMPLIRFVANLFIRIIFNFYARGRVTDPLSGMRAFRKDKIRVTEDGFLVDLEIAFNALEIVGESRAKMVDNDTICEVPIKTRYVCKSGSKFGDLKYAAWEYMRMVWYCLNRMVR